MRDGDGAGGRFRGAFRALRRGLARRLARLSVRLVAFNLLLVLAALGGAFWVGLDEILGRYEDQLLESQERSMAQQGRLLAAALARSADGGAPAPLETRGAEEILAGLEQRITARLRVWDPDGRVLADSSRMGPRRDELEDPGEAAEAGPSPPEERWLYRLGAAPFRLWRRVQAALAEPPPGGGSIPPEAREPAAPALPTEVAAALAGRYGAAVRPTPGQQRSVTLHVAVPVQSGAGIVGAAQASQSTYRILQDLRQARLAFFQVFLASVAVAVVLSLGLGATISRPLRRLRAEAATLVDRRGRLRGTFSGSDHLDEIGDLARSLEALSLRVEEHVRFIESFAADVSHEFKNPLTSIRAATEMLADAGDPEERRALLGTVEAEVSRLEGLLTAVREMSWIDSRLDEEPGSTVDLGGLLEELVEGFRQRAPESVEVALERPAEPVAVIASPDRLAQVFENLLDNAAGFAPEGSTVAVHLAFERDRVGGRTGGRRRDPAGPGAEGSAVVTVGDQGPGIPPEHLDRIFDRFFSYRPSGPEPGAGPRRHAGLGLAIVRAIVEGYGGSVEVQNARRGGAELRVRLPAAPKPRSQRRAPGFPAHALGLGLGLIVALAGGLGPVAAPEVAAMPGPPDTVGARTGHPARSLPLEVVPAGAREVLLEATAGSGHVYRVVWRDGRTELLTPEAFAALLHDTEPRRRPLFAFLDITSPVGVAWVALGFAGQLLFTGRMLVQWLTSERRRRSVVPVAFWWMSLAGASLLVVYFVWRQDVVGVLGQAAGWVVYGRNLRLIYRDRVG